MDTSRESCYQGLYIIQVFNNPSLFNSVWRIVPGALPLYKYIKSWNISKNMQCCILLVHKFSSYIYKGWDKMQRMLQNMKSPKTASLSPVLLLCPVNRSHEDSSMLVVWLCISLIVSGKSCTVQFYMKSPAGLESMYNIFFNVSLALHVSDKFPPKSPSLYLCLWDLMGTVRATKLVAICLENTVGI